MAHGSKDGVQKTDHGPAERTKRVRVVVIGAVLIVAAAWLGWGQRAVIVHQTRGLGEAFGAVVMVLLIAFAGLVTIGSQARGPWQDRSLYAGLGVLWLVFVAIGTHMLIDPQAAVGITFPGEADRGYPERTIGSAAEARFIGACILLLCTTVGAAATGYLRSARRRSRPGADPTGEPAERSEQRSEPTKYERMMREDLGISERPREH